MGENRLMADLYEENQRLKERIEELEEKHYVECTIISQYDDELKEAKRLLNAAVKDFRRVTQGCIGIQCDSCPHTATHKGCIWQYAAEALKLIGEDGDAE